jgi:hypothetical protein
VKVSGTYRHLNHLCNASNCTDLPGISDRIPALPQKGMGLSFQEYGMNSPQNSNPHSFHRSSQRDGGSHAQYDDILHNIMRDQRNVQSTIPIRDSPASSQFQSSYSSQTERPPSRPVTVVPTSSGSPGTTNQSNDKIRVNCTLDSTLLNFWLELDRHADAFIAYVQEAFKKRKLPFAQSATTILFKPDPRTPDESGYLLILDEDDLEADWAGTVSWLRENKNAASPHIFGTIHIENE